MSTKRRLKIKSKNTPNQGTPKKCTSKKTYRETSPKQNANNYDNIKVTELLSRRASLEKIVDELKSELTIIKNVNTKLSNKLDPFQIQLRSLQKKKNNKKQKN